MTTRVDIGAKAAAELGDSGAAKLWSNALLYGWLADGLYALSLDFPPRRNISLPLVPNQTDYGLAANSVGPGGILSVEYPVGQPLPRGSTRIQQEGSSFSGQGMSPSYPFGNCWELVWTAPTIPVLRFRYPLLAVSGSTNLNLWVYGVYSVPAGDADVLELAAMDEQLLVWWICGRALGWLEEQRLKRGTAAAGKSPGAAAYYDTLYRTGVVSRRRGAGLRQGTLQTEV